MQESSTPSRVSSTTGTIAAQELAQVHQSCHPLTGNMLRLLSVVSASLLCHKEPLAHVMSAVFFGGHNHGSPSTTVAVLVFFVIFTGAKAKVAQDGTPRSRATIKHVVTCR